MFSRSLAPFSQSRQLRANDPFADLHREMNRLFDDFIGGPVAGMSREMMMAPRLDVTERDNEIRVCAELPGVDPSQVDVRLDGSMLTIRGEKKDEHEQDQSDYHVMERSFGRFQRSLQLPFEPDGDQVRAEFRHGVLTIHVPKQPQQEKSRRIAIEGAEPASSQQKGQQKSGGAQGVNVKH